MKFLHTMIRVRNLEKSLKFYTELIGLKHIKTLYFEGATLFYLSDAINQCLIELSYNPLWTEKDYELGSAFGHFAFECEDMDIFTEKLIVFGLEYTCPPFTVNEMNVAFLKDPDGYLIEVIERWK